MLSAETSKLGLDNQIKNTGWEHAKKLKKITAMNLNSIQENRHFEHNW